MASKSSPDRWSAFLKTLELDPLWEPRPGGALHQRDRPRIEQPAPASAPVSRVPAPALAQAAAASKPDTPERASMIASMDWPTLEATVAECVACPLWETRTRTVFGVGDRRASWFIVGEAPGAEEDKRGEPFVGRAGKLLDAMLAAMGLRRGEDVFISNVLKSRPPNNRDPLGLEVQQCEPYLKRQIALVQPKIIIALGRFAVQSLMHAQASLSELRGKPHVYEGIPLIVTYHPAYLLRSPLEKRKTLADLRLAQQVMHQLRDGAGSVPAQS